MGSICFCITIPLFWGIAFLYLFRKDLVWQFYARNYEKSGFHPDALKREPPEVGFNILGIVFLLLGVMSTLLTLNRLVETFLLGR